MFPQLKLVDLTERGHLRDVGVDERIKLEWTLNRMQWCVDWVSSGAR
jgi:hypothetical protein